MSESSESLRDTLDAVPAEARAVIVDELTLASAVINNMGTDWTPNEHGLAVERAVKTFLEVWPTRR